MRALAAIGVAIALLMPAHVHAEPGFDRFLESEWPAAQALACRAPPSMPRRAGWSRIIRCPISPFPAGRKKPPPGQAEFVQTPGQYLREPTFDRLAARGRQLAAQHRDTLSRIEKEFGVPGNVVLAIWARETDYGGYNLPLDAIRTLATQAYVGKRKEFFQNEFQHALKMLQDGVPRADMRSSWGGALGMTQFLPSEFDKYGVDFDGDGRADIWHSVPDALGVRCQATRRQRLAGGASGGPTRVHAPPNADCSIGVSEHILPIGEWLKRGFVPAHGLRLNAAERAIPASLLQAGRQLRPVIPDAEELLRHQRL